MFPKPSVEYKNASFIKLKHVGDYFETLRIQSEPRALSIGRAPSIQSRAKHVSHIHLPGETKNTPAKFASWPLVSAYQPISRR